MTLKRWTLTLLAPVAGILAVMTADSTARWLRQQRRWTPLRTRLRLTRQFFQATGVGTPQTPIAIARMVFGYTDGQTSAHPKDCCAVEPVAVLDKAAAALSQQWPTRPKSVGAGAAAEDRPAVG